MDYEPTLRSTGQPNIGSGLAQGAIDVNQLYKQYQAMTIEAQMNGQVLPPFAEWVKLQGQQMPSVMPR